MQVRVVGSGPAGLMAAEVLAQGGAKVTIIDHHASPARKFLLAGRGGLNLTHSEPLDKMLTRYGGAQSKLEPIIKAFPPDALRAWCHDLGIETFVGSSGRVFPKGLKASPLLRAWLRRLGGLGVELRLREKWTGFDDVPTVLALGGASWPELGSDGAWRGTFEAAGIAVKPFVASNVRLPMAWSDVFSSRFAGEPIKNVTVRCGAQVSRGEVMISKDGIEGGAIYALSRALREQASLTLEIDLKPDLTIEAVQERLSRHRGRDSRSTFLRKVLNLTPQAIGLMREANSDNPKHVVLHPTGPGDLRRAISTAGGVSWDEVGEDLRLIKKPNTFIAGEMLDWDAPTGGYLLQASMAMGRWAGEGCLKKFSSIIG
jgi:uncharacterized flavoprotein (TIGR03862 family)